MEPTETEPTAEQVADLRTVLDNALAEPDNGVRPPGVYPPGAELPTAAVEALEDVTDSDLAASYRRAVGIE